MFERETILMKEIFAAAANFRIQTQAVIPNHNKDVVINTDQTGNKKKSHSYIYNEIKFQNLCFKNMPKLFVNCYFQPIAIHLWSNSYHPRWCSSRERIWIDDTLVRIQHNMLSPYQENFLQVSSVAYKRALDRLNQGCRN